jgi:hypothetical protein
MIDQIPTQESSAERFPNEREVLNLLEDIIGGDFEIGRTLENEEGLYLLEVHTTDETGDPVTYMYKKVGAYPESQSARTAIEVVYYNGDIPCGGDTVAILENGVWDRKL